MNHKLDPVLKKAWQPSPELAALAGQDRLRWRR